MHSVGVDMGISTPLAACCHQHRCRDVSLPGLSGQLGGAGGTEARDHRMGLVGAPGLGEQCRSNARLPCTERCVAIGMMEDQPANRAPKRANLSRDVSDQQHCYKQPMILGRFYSAN